MYSIYDVIEDEHKKCVCIENWISKMKDILMNKAKVVNSQNQLKHYCFRLKNV